MTLPFIAVFLAFVLCYAPRAASSLGAPAEEASSAKGRKRGPRGWRRRALEAHDDASRVFAPFAAGVIVAHLAGLDPYRSGLIAMTFVGARVLHLAAALAGLDYLRATAWGVGFLSTAMLYLLPWLL